jgi:hypothetical protein
MLSDSWVLDRRISSIGDLVRKILEWCSVIKDWAALLG